MSGVGLGGEMQGGCCYVRDKAMMVCMRIVERIGGLWTVGPAAFYDGCVWDESFSTFAPCVDDDSGFA